MNMAGFTDEYIKISASKQEAGYMQTRTGRRPIRVDTLRKKDLDKKAAPVAEAAQAAAKTPILKSLLSRIWKPAAFVGTGAAGMKGLEEYGLEPMELGYQVMRARGEI